MNIKIRFPRNTIQLNGIVCTLLRYKIMRTGSYGFVWSIVDILDGSYVIDNVHDLYDVNHDNFQIGCVYTDSMNDDYKLYLLALSDYITH